MFYPWGKKEHSKKSQSILIPKDTKTHTNRQEKRNNGPKKQKTTKWKQSFSINNYFKCKEMKLSKLVSSNG